MIFNQHDQGAFVEFETDAWIRTTPHFESLASRMTRQIVGPILDAAGFGPVEIHGGTTLLEVASGPGYVAAAAYNRGALPTGAGLSADMVAMAREHFPTVDFRQGDAEKLALRASPLRRGRLLLRLAAFPAAREGGRRGPARAAPWRAIRLHRLVRPDKGQVIRHNQRDCAAPYSDLGAAPARFGRLYVQRPDGVPGGDGRCTLCQRDRRGSPCLFEMSDSGDIFEFVLKCGPRAVSIYERQSPAARAAIEQALREAGRQAMAAEGGRIPCPALMVSGVKKES